MDAVSFLSSPFPEWKEPGLRFTSRGDVAAFDGSRITYTIFRSFRLTAVEASHL